MPSPVGGPNGIPGPPVKSDEESLWIFRAGKAAWASITSLVISGLTASRIISTNATGQMSTPAAISTDQSLTLSTATGTTLTVSSTQDTTSIITGAIVTSGGIAAAKGITSGTHIDAAGGFLSAGTGGGVSVISWNRNSATGVMYDSGRHGVTTVCGSGNDWEFKSYTGAGAFVDSPLVVALAAGGTVTVNRPFLVAAATVTLADACNIVVNTTTGTKIGTATSQKLAFFNSTPIVQPANTTDLRTAIINLGLLATGGATPLDLNGGAFTTSSTVSSTGPTAGIGYATGAGGTVTQGTSRTTGVTLNKVCGQITLFSAAGSATWQSFTVTNSAVATTDTIIVNQDSGTDKYMIHVTAVGAGSFEITYATTGGTTTEQPVFNFSVIKAVTA